MNIQWYPGHMTKAKRAMKEDVKLVDLVIELVDARAPLASRNPDIDSLAAGKGRVILLNKADLASEKANAAWITYFESQGFQVMKIDARAKATLKQLNALIQEACKEKIERDRRRGNKPGVTKGNQWIRLNKQVELLDTPGILWPKFEDQRVGLLLAFLGSINDEILEKDELASELADYLRNITPGLLKERYGIEEDGKKPYELLDEIAAARACLTKGGVNDLTKAARLLLDEFRGGKLGRITLEMPEKKEEAE